MIQKLYVSLCSVLDQAPHSEGDFPLIITRFLIRQSPTEDFLRTTLRRTITQYEPLIILSLHVFDLWKRNWKTKLQNLRNSISLITSTDRQNKLWTLLIQPHSQGFSLRWIALWTRLQLSDLWKLIFNSVFKFTLKPIVNLCPY